MQPSSVKRAWLHSSHVTFTVELLRRCWEAQLKEGRSVLLKGFIVFFLIACVARVPVWFLSKDLERLKNGIFGLGCPRNGTRAKKWKRGEGEGKEGNLPYLSSPPLLALLFAPFFTRFLTLVPRSLHLNRTETLATQAIFLRVLSWAWTLTQVSTTGVYTVACIKDNLHRPPVHSVCVTAARSLFWYPAGFPFIENGKPWSHARGNMRISWLVFVRINRLCGIARSVFLSL